MPKWIYLSGFILFGMILESGGQKVDIAFILDGSGSVFDTHPSIWENQLDLMGRMINSLNIGRDSVRVAMVTFSDVARVRWNLDRYFDSNSLISAIKSLRFTGGKSNIYGGLVAAWRNVFGGSQGDRADAPNVIVIFSDGFPTLNIDLTMSTAEDMHADGIWMSAVGIGARPNRLVLRYMSNMQNVVDTDQLRSQIVFSNFVSKLREETASSPINEDPCASAPCLNGGQCSKSEDPFKWGFYCWCPTVNNAGGRLCQIINPCGSCPENTWRCVIAITSDKGRFCYSKGYGRLLD